MEKARKWTQEHAVQKNTVSPSPSCFLCDVVLKLETFQFYCDLILLVWLFDS